MSSSYQRETLLPSAIEICEHIYKFVTFTHLYMHLQIGLYFEFKWMFVPNLKNFLEGIPKILR